MCSTCLVSLVLVCEHKDPVPCALYKAWVIGFAPLVHVSVFVLVPHCFCYDISVIQLQIWNTNPSSTVFFLCPTPRIILDILGLLWFHMNFRIFFPSVSMKKCCEYDWDHIESKLLLIDQSLPNINFIINHDHEKSFHFLVSFLSFSLHDCKVFILAVFHLLCLAYSQLLCFL